MGVNDVIPAKSKKVISDIYAVIDLPVGNTLTLSYSTSVDINDFATLYTFTSNANEQNIRVRIPTTLLQNINWYRLKLNGTGHSKVHYLEIHGRFKE